MSIVSSMGSLFEVPADKPELNRAQLAALHRQVPAMYVIVIINTLALTYTHLDSSPYYLTVLAPGGLILLSLFRLIVHHRVVPEKLSDAEVLAKLRMTVRLAMILGAMFWAWSLSLFNYGDAYAKGHVAFFAGLTTFGCAICLVHTRAAAMGIIIVVAIPFALFFGLSREPALVAIAVNMAAVSAVTAFVLTRYHKDFSDMISYQMALKTKQDETQALSDSNSRLANLDSLTGLPNRRSFFSRLKTRVGSGTVKENLGIGVGILDLDGFKQINDIYGHSAGDRLLVEVGVRLSNMLNGEVFVARLGGDEFGLLVDGSPHDYDLKVLGDRLCEMMRVPFEMDGFTANMSASVGFAVYPDSADTMQLLFERADYALYYAKQFSAGATVLFSAEHEAEIREVSGIERRLRDADFSEEMYLVFQPIVDSVSGRARGVEVLARWQSPILGAVSPVAFIRAAERAGLINQLTEILFQKALDIAEEWPEDVFLSFNLSPFDIGSRSCVLKLMGISERSSIAANRITYEITESAVMHDYEGAVEALHLLKNMGSHIALDDFGTGYSSLSYLRSLPLDKLKLDRSFIVDIDKDESARAIVRSVVGLCENLKLDCIVEGVESEGQLKSLEEIGCQTIQGYLFSKPLSEADIGKYLSAQQRLQVQA